MAEQIRKVTVGEPVGDPSAAFQHATVDTIRYVRQLQSMGGAGTGSGAASAGVVQVKNTSGAARACFDVLGIDDTVFPTPTNNLDAFKLGPVLYGVTPNVAVHEQKFVILLSPARIDAIVPAAIASPTIVKVHVTDEHYNYARIKAGDAGSMESAPAGYPILYRESGTGDKWAEVNLGVWVDPPVGFELDENHPGRGVAFDVTVGTWGPSVDNHIYGTWTAKAIDWFSSDPAITPNRSDTHTWIIDAWTIDCDAP
jgi:hypothetical protein